MLNYFRRRKQAKVLRSYVYRLAPALCKRYGAADQYSVLQIQKTAQSLHLSKCNFAYAIAMFRHQQSSHCLELYAIDQQRLDTLRQQIAQALFAGNDRYRAHDIYRLSQARAWRGGASPDWMSNRFGRTSL